MMTHRLFKQQYEESLEENKGLKDDIKRLFETDLKGEIDFGYKLFKKD